MKNVVVALRLVSEWMGNPVGTIVRVGEKQAKSMLNRKIAKEVTDGKEKKEERNGSSEVEAGQEVVKLQKRDKDKMIKTSINKGI